MSTGASSKGNEAYFQAIRPGKSQLISFTNSAMSSAVLQTSPRTTLVSFFPTQDCWILVGENGSTVAAINDGRSMFIPGGIRDFIGIEETLQNPIISVVRDSTSGNLHIVECADPGVKQ